VGRDSIVYDDDCSFCRWSLGLVLAWDRRHALRPVALQDPEARELLRDVPAEERMESWHLVTEAGVSSAGAAAPRLLRGLPGGGPLARLLDRFPKATERAYRLVADNRSKLGKLIPRRAVARADERIDARRG
jgi:predicted DCC family thiol-disulfide oxidoreductase YuxK